MKLCFSLIQTLFVCVLCVHSAYCQKVDPDWFYTDFADQAASLGLEFTDLDNDGQNEIIGGNFSKIYVLKLTDEPYQFQTYELSCFEQRIGDFAIFDEDGDGDTEIFVINLTGGIYKLDVEEGKTIEEYVGDTDILEPASIVVDDLDQDGVLDFVVGPRSGFSTRGFLSIYNPTFRGLELKKSFLSVDVEDIHLADVNLDGYQDIIQATALNNLLIIDGLTLEVLQDRRGLIEQMIAVADVDGNDTIEIIDLEDDQLRIYNALDLALINSFPIKERYVASLNVMDASPEEGLEVLIGSGSSGNPAIYCYNLLSGELIWEKSNFAPYWDYLSIQFFDIDFDGEKEFVFGAETAFSGALMALDSTGSEVEYWSQNFIREVRHQVRQAASGNGNGLFLLTEEYLPERAGESYIFRQFTLNDYDLMQEDTLDLAGGTIKSFAVGQFRDMENAELTILQSNAIQFFDLATKTPLGDTLTSETDFASVLVEDVNQDGLDELIVLLDDATVEIFGFEAGEFTKINSSSSLFNSFRARFRHFLKIANADADDDLELLISFNQELKIIDLTSLEVDQTLSLPSNFIGDFVVSESISDDSLFLYSNDGGSIFKFDLNTGTLVDQKSFNSTFVDATISIGRYLNSAEESLIVTDGYEIFFVNPEDLSTVQSSKSNAFVSRQISRIQRENGDDFILGTNSGMYIFSLASITTDVSSFDFDLQAGPKVYPNPTDHSIFIEDQKGFSSYVLYSIQGQVLRSGNMDQSNQLDLGGLEKGTYILKLLGSKQAVSKTIIKH